MKRLILISLLGLAVAIWPGGRIAYAQHGHGPGGMPGMSGMSGTGTHGDSGTHGESDAHGANGQSTENGNAPSSASASSLLSRNQHLDTALTKALGNLVPPGGLATGCQGFSNLGRCISAIHVAHNRNLDFFCLRRAMTGEALPSADTTPCSATQTNLKLGRAIQTLDPNADPKVEATKGTRQANADIKGAKS